MRRSGPIALSLLLAAGIHLDWHLARPHHYRLSLEWSEHWLFAAALFALAGCVVARLWPAERGPVGARTLGLAIVLAQVVEPVLESAFYAHRLAYHVESARWAAFVTCLAVGIPAYALALWLCAPSLHPRGGGGDLGRLGATG